MIMHRVKQRLLAQPKSNLTDEDVEELARENAAIRIQRAWRAKKRAAYLGTDFLWTDLITHARFKVSLYPRPVAFYLRFRRVIARLARRSTVTLQSEGKTPLGNAGGVRYSLH